MSAIQRSLCAFLSIFVVKCQEPERFYFFGFDEQPLDWIENNGTLYLDDVNCYDPIKWTTKQRCPRYKMGFRLAGDTKCVHIFADTDISRVISTVDYHSIYLTIGVNPWDLEANEWCYIQYRTASTEWINTNIINGSDDSITFNLSIPDTIHYNNQSSFELKIGIQSSGCGDSCFYDHLELFGIPYTQNPTIDPTNAPSSSPTNAPTFHQTETTNEPNSSPTSHSNNPTVNPTKKPSLVPTKYPTIAPTFDPSFDPTFMPLMTIITIYHDHDTMNSDVSTSDTTYDVIASDSLTSLSSTAQAVLISLSVVIIGFSIYLCHRWKRNKWKEVTKAVEFNKKDVPSKDNDNSLCAPKRPKVELSTGGITINAQKVTQGSAKVTKRAPVVNIANDSQKYRGEGVKNNMEQRAEYDDLGHNYNVDGMRLTVEGAVNENAEVMTETGANDETKGEFRV